jgi:hypothetical protein
LLPQSNSNQRSAWEWAELNHKEHQVHKEKQHNRPENLCDLYGDKVVCYISAAVVDK